MDCFEGVTFYFNSWFIFVSLCFQFLFIFSTLISFVFIMNAEDAHILYNEFLTHAFINVNFSICIYSAKKYIILSHAQKTHGS